MAPRDRAWIRRITLATLRHLGRSDAVLSHFVKQEPSVHVRNILRLALTEIFAFQTQPWAVIDSAVRVTGRDHRHFRSKGFVNAVLRSAMRNDGKLLWDEATPTRLPTWIGEPIRHEFGVEALRAIEEAHEVEPALDITPKVAGDAANLAKRLRAKNFPNGSLRLFEKGQVSRLSGYEEGEWWVQDLASSCAVRLLGEVKNKRVLDLCAAPGGKTLQCCAQGADVTALDKSKIRLEILRCNLRRTQLSAKTIHCDALNWQTSPATAYDIVIVDAPCSASGTIRRHPDLPFRRDGKEGLAALVNQQRQFLKKAYDFTRNGGLILYSTCSLFPQEGEEIVAWAKERLKITSLNIDLATIGLDRSWQTDEGAFRTRPDFFWQDEGGMDGFYAAVLVKGSNV